jgi:hypothetical protein
MKIAIVGGGTSGLVTALILKQDNPKFHIDLIESKKIGIIGVGEGSTEHWSTFMHHCNINLAELIEETDATFKYGINFVNWNGDNQRYIHSLSGELTVESQTGLKFLFADMIARGEPSDNLVPDHVVNNLHIKPYHGVNQFHFNTFKLNEYLHKLCEKRGIGIIEDDIAHVQLDEDGCVDYLLGKYHHYYDFYVDSTGFGRIINQKSLGAQWISYSKYLPLNSAIAFPTERLEDIPSTTLSRSMDCGWLWRIPTQNRFGNGYVFCDRFITAEEAHREVEELYGKELEIAKHVKFDPGRLDKAWSKNCVAIGLSASFIEPLEATSIGCSIQQAFMLTNIIHSYDKRNTYAEDYYNHHFAELLDNILDFVALHYRCKRNDTAFWKYATSLPLPPGLEQRLEMYQYRYPDKGDFLNHYNMFREANWIQVMHGLGLIPPTIAQRRLHYEPDHILSSIQINFNAMKREMNAAEHVSHREALQAIIDNKQEYAV